MDDRKILYKAILKAEEDGYKEHLGFLPVNKVKKPEELAKIIFFGRCSSIIFSHEFAKAFWGEEKFMHWVEGQIDQIVDEVPQKVVEDGNYNFGESWSAYQPLWKFHLSKMVLEPEPLKYLARFLK